MQLDGAGFPTSSRAWSVTLPGLPGLTCAVQNVTWASLSCLTILNASSAGQLLDGNGTLMVRAVRLRVSMHKPAVLHCWLMHCL